MPRKHKGKRANARFAQSPAAVGETQTAIQAGFTLADEARQTSLQDHSSWDRSHKLRCKPVSFTSAGNFHPRRLPTNLEMEKARDSEAGSTVWSRGPCSPAPSDSNLQPPPSPNHCPALQMPIHVSSASLEKTSPGSDSGDEVILFRGRRGRGASSTPNMNSPLPPPLSHGVQISDVHHQLESLEIRSKSRSKRFNWQEHDSDDHDLVLADYIANMRENGELNFPEGSSLQLRQRSTHSSIDISGTDHLPQHEVSENGVLKTRSFNETSSDGTQGNASTYKIADQSDDESNVDIGAWAKLLASHDLDTGTQSLADSDSFCSTEEDETAETFDLAKYNLSQHRIHMSRRLQKAMDDDVFLRSCNSQLRQQLQAAWMSDRRKKIQRRKIREELRASGRLGRKSNPRQNDLTMKYPTGMSIHEVADEIRHFLMGDEISMAFPPMDLHARKMIHELANRFKINSKSTGKADQRRPILFRTGKTLPYVESKFEQAVGRMRRRYMPRTDIRAKRGAGAAPQARSRHAATSYRDGEIVGAAAPELGADNRGRAMLEKMGWSSGTALGATHNKGIMQPVEHIMKSSKAGLG